LLAAEGIEVDHSTLFRWTRRHHATYEQLARNGGSN
jgi:transposase-like protein